MVKNTWTEPSDFKPLAYYHSERDLVYVLIRNCMVTRVTVNDVIDMLEIKDPNGGEDKCVGFVIKSAKEFCIKYRLKYYGEIDLLELIDRIMLIYLCPTTYQDEIYRILALVPAHVHMERNPPQTH